MDASQNGWTCDPAQIARYSLPGGEVALRKGDVSVVLLWCANRWHETVEPLRWPGVWGYAQRLISGSSSAISNHASGTAIDINAPEHPMGTDPRANFTPAHIAAVHAICAYCEGAVRWGGDYTGRKDGMHLEINAGAQAVARIANKIRGQVDPVPTPTPSPPYLEDDLMGAIRITPDDAGRFHEAQGAEAGGGSNVATRGWAVFGSTYGGTTWTVAALADDGTVLAYWPNVRTNNNTNTARDLPDGTRCVTVEGQVDNAGTRPWASTYGIR